MITLSKSSLSGTQFTSLSNESIEQDTLKPLPAVLKTKPSYLTAFFPKALGSGTEVELLSEYPLNMIIRQLSHYKFEQYGINLFSYFNE